MATSREITQFLQQMGFLFIIFGGFVGLFTNLKLVGFVSILLGMFLLVISG